MKPIVKICGLSTEETLDAALAAGADMVGFVLFPPSPRNISVGRATELASRARGRAEVVVLTVNMDERETAETVDAVGPDWLQLHGGESADQVKAARKTFGVKVMKALPVDTPADVDRISGYAAVSDRLILDAKPAHGATRPGGLGVAFDWALVADFDPGIPWLISGGLTPGNVADALTITGAAGVDVSSGVETAPGVKDPDLIRAFVSAARAAAAASVAP